MDTNYRPQPLWDRVRWYFAGPIARALYYSLDMRGNDWRTSASVIYNDSASVGVWFANGQYALRAWSGPRGNYGDDDLVRSGQKLVWHSWNARLLWRGYKRWLSKQPQPHQNNQSVIERLIR
jgi:hypothetical protein